MPLLDDLKVTVGEEELSRRKLLGLAGSGALAVAAAGSGVTTVEYLWPKVLFEPQTRFKVGRPDQIPVGHVSVLPKQKLYVVRSPEGFYAMSAVCTHLGCMTRWEPEAGRVFCPCHGSRFSKEGKVDGGPAPKALPRFALVLEKGELVVDTKVEVAGDFVLEV